MNKTICSARVLLGELASLARLVYASGYALDVPRLRESVMRVYDIAEAHLAELEGVELDA